MSKWEERVNRFASFLSQNSLDLQFLSIFLSPDLMIFPIIWILSLNWKCSQQRHLIICSKFCFYLWSMIFHFVCFSNTHLFFSHYFFYFIVSRNFFHAVSFVTELMCKKVAKREGKGILSSGKNSTKVRHFSREGDNRSKF